MRIVLAVVLAAAVSLAAVAAWAEEVQGKVQTVNAAERMIVLEDGTQIWVAEGLPLENLKEGVTVKASYEERDGKKVATIIEITP
ncbi:MAG: hypothetical protein DMD79_05210 [Candidatus Rokuibacteriota bacterium]|nr:MAG: hypothetical protein DMD79_05210 [Candidatus Rokubacteria bacterium]